MRIHSCTPAWEGSCINCLCAQVGSRHSSSLVLRPSFGPYYSIPPASLWFAMQCLADGSIALLLSLRGCREVCSRTTAPFQNRCCEGAHQSHNADHSGGRADSLLCSYALARPSPRRQPKGRCAVIGKAAEDADKQNAANKAPRYPKEQTFAKTR